MYDVLLQRRWRQADTETEIIISVKVVCTAEMEEESEQTSDLETYNVKNLKHHVLMKFYFAMLHVVQKQPFTYKALFRIVADNILCFSLDILCGNKPWHFVRLSANLHEILSLILVEK